MNHLLKRQPSPCAVVLLNSNKQGNTKYCPCKNCFLGQPVFYNSVQEASSYISALKFKLDKVKTFKKEEDNAVHSDFRKHSQDLKLMPFNCAFKRQTNLARSSETYRRKGWKSRYNIGSTKSFDPNLLSKSLEVEEFYEDFGKKKKFRAQTNFSIVNVTQNLKNKAMVFEQLNKVHIKKDFDNAEPTKVMFNEIRQAQKGKEITNAYTSLKRDKIHGLKANKPNELSLFTLQKSIKVEKEYSQKYITSLDPKYNLTQFLHSSIDICITNNMIKEAYQLFYAYKKKLMLLKNKRSVTEVYNTLLFALSTKGYWHVFKTVADWMEKDGIKMNAESFAAMLHCLAKIREVGNEKLVQEETLKILNWLFVNGVSVNDIFTKTKLRKDVAEKVLHLLREVIPSFEVKSDTTMELSSNCILLKKLNETESNLQPQIDSSVVDTTEDLVEEQMLIERNFYVEVKAVCSGRPTEYYAKKTERIEALKEHWKKSLTEAVFKFQKAQKKEFTKFPQSYLYIYLNSLPKEKFVDILMRTTLQMLDYCGCYGPSVDAIRRVIGSQVAKCYQLRKKEVTGTTNRTEELFKKFIPWYFNPHGFAKNSRQHWQMLIQDSDKASHLDCAEIEWTDEIRNKLGKFLLDVIFNEINFTVSSNCEARTLPVFYTVIRYRDNEYREEIKCHPYMTIFENSKFETLHFRADEIPMVCPPKPWSSVNHGGYLSLSTDFIRKPGGLQGKHLNLSDVPVQEMYATFDSLNALQAVPWMINEEVLDVALEVFKNGGSEELSVPLTPEKPPLPNKFSLDMNYQERKKEIQKRNEIIKCLANNYSLWCEALYRLSLANHFRKRIFWLPQNCDFRGRVYPVPPLLNHIGGDMYRSLLLFAKGKPLGPKGLDWLKIHLINLTGTHKKKSVEERLKYANEILPVILDSAEKPLTGFKWWVKSDEPWQTLATCFELKKALSAPNPEQYICRFPIHQDGSCNGLQHYAALGRDMVGANSVNLVSRRTPQDVYNVVADLIEKERVKDAEEGYDIANILEGFVQRKVIKQTVMTTVYGVTPYGAKSQIERRLEEIPNFPQEYVPLAAAYLTHKTFYCLEKMFTSAKKIQDWFVVCAREICAKNDYVHWISPLGLPVLQPYAKRVRGGLNCMTVPDSRKQTNAFPPNFIHSLDSSHMMLTALYCEQVGLTFGAVHDCFWTHPNCVDIMNKICREQFISLHSQLILEDLSNFFIKYYLRTDKTDKALKVFKAVPEKGNFDLREVLKSVYFFS